MFSILTGSGLIAVIAGAVIIAKAVVSRRSETLPTRVPENAGANLPLFAVLDDQRIEIRLGLSLIVFGSILILLHFTGLPLEPVTVTILAFLGFIFLTAHARYARELRATQPQRLAALLTRTVAAQDDEKASTSASVH